MISLIPSLRPFGAGRVLEQNPWFLLKEKLRVYPKAAAHAVFGYALR